MNKLEKMLSIKETAQALGISPKKVRRLIQKGEIVALQLAEHSVYRISTKEVDRLRSSQGILKRIFGRLYTEKKAKKSGPLGKETD